MMKTGITGKTKNTTVRTVLNSNINIVDKSNTHIYDRSLSWLGTGNSIITS